MHASDKFTVEMNERLRQSFRSCLAQILDNFFKLISDSIQFLLTVRLRTNLDRT